MTNIYPIDDILAEFLISVMPDSKYIRYINIFNTVDALNVLDNNDHTLLLDELENGMLDIIFGLDTIKDEKYIQVEMYFINKLIGLLSEYGIYLNVDVTVKELEGILTSLFIIYTIDINIIELISLMLTDENMDDEEIALSSIIAEYTDIPITRLYELIEDVSTDGIVELNDYLNTRLKMSTDPLNEHMVTKVTSLVEQNEIYGKTYIARNVLFNGFLPIDINDSIRNLYKYIDMYKSEVMMIPYEIIATFYLLLPTTDNLIGEIDERLIYENVRLLQNNHEYINTIKTLVSELASKLKG